MIAKNKYYVQQRNGQEKKSKTLSGIKPTTFRIPVGCSNHWAMSDSYGELVVGYFVRQHRWVGGWIDRLRLYHNIIFNFVHFL